MPVQLLPMMQPGLLLIGVLKLGAPQLVEGSNLELSQLVASPHETMIGCLTQDLGHDRLSSRCVFEAIELGRDRGTRVVGGSVVLIYKPRLWTLMAYQLSSVILVYINPTLYKSCQLYLRSKQRMSSMLLNSPRATNPYPQAGESKTSLVQHFH